ncbi:MAG: hypothetical protein QOJ64_1334 [Acidobacteriota bacterium]|jgi:hypothetical protein|nr:hypothetical protein [Acidobacteriota bacterium]
MQQHKISRTGKTSVRMEGLRSYSRWVSANLSEGAMAQQPAKRTNEKSPAIHRWGKEPLRAWSPQDGRLKSSGSHSPKRAFSRPLHGLDQTPSPLPSIEMLGYSHSSASRTKVVPFHESRPTRYRDMGRASQITEPT